MNARQRSAGGSRASCGASVPVVSRAAALVAACVSCRANGLNWWCCVVAAFFAPLNTAAVTNVAQRRRLFISRSLLRRTRGRSAQRQTVIPDHPRRDRRVVAAPRRGHVLSSVCVPSVSVWSRAFCAVAAVVWGGAPVSAPRQWRPAAVCGYRSGGSAHRPPPPVLCVECRCRTLHSALPQLEAIGALARRSRAPIFASLPLLFLPRSLS